MTHLEKQQRFAELVKLAETCSSEKVHVGKGLVTVFPAAPDHETSIEFYSNGWEIFSSVYSETTYDRWDLAEQSPTVYVSQYVTEPQMDGFSVEIETDGANSESEVPWTGLRSIWKSSKLRFSSDGKYYRENETTGKWELSGDLNDFTAEEWRDFRKRENPPRKGGTQSASSGPNGCRAGMLGLVVSLLLLVAVAKCASG